LRAAHCLADPTLLGRVLAAGELSYWLGPRERTTVCQAYQNGWHYLHFVDLDLKELVIPLTGF